MNSVASATTMAMIDEQRAQRGFMSVSDTMNLCARGNVILDPFSTLISIKAIIGENNIFYPHVVVEVAETGRISISNGNVFWPNCLLLADSGLITIASGNEFGDGGVSIKANQSTSEITVGSYGRYIGGVQILGKTSLGDGTQVLGSITVQNCILESGESYKHPSPDQRGALLKGFGLARNITLSQGYVVEGFGHFDQIHIKLQSYFHPIQPNSNQQTGTQNEEKK